MKKKLFFLIFLSLFLMLIPFKTNAESTVIKKINLNEGTVFLDLEKNSDNNYYVTIIGEVFTINSIEKEDSTAKEEYSPAKSITINPGESKSISIVITDQGNNKKTYTITAYRVDNRSSDSTLKELNVSNTNIKFDGNSSYSATVNNDVDKVEIKAVSSNSNSSVVGTGIKELKVGKNSFEVIVTPEKGEKKTYTINIVRNDKEKDDKKVELSSNNYLEELNIEGIENLNFASELLDYKIEVENNIKEIKLNYKTTDEKSKVSVNGNTKLNVGTNKIVLVVTAENGDVRKYNLTINRKKEEEIIDVETSNLLNLLDSKDNTIVVKLKYNKNDSTDINKKIIQKLKETKKTIVYEISNNAGKLLYSVTIDGSKINNKITKLNYGLSFTTNNKAKIDKLVNNNSPLYLNFAHSGILPENTKFKIYVGNRFKNSEKAYLYYYNPTKGSLEYIEKNIKTNNEYITLNIDHCSDYILLNSKINNSNKIFIIMILAIIATILIFGFIYYIFRKRKNKKNNSDNIVVDTTISSDLKKPEPEIINFE